MNKKNKKRIKYFFRFIPDKLYLQLYHFAQFKKFICFNNPKTYNEKINWLKLYDRNPKYTKMVDKYEAKEYVKKIIGEEYIIPTLGIWDKFDNINFDSLPNQFVLKCTHDSEGLVIVKDKSKLNIKEAKMKIDSAMKYNFYYIGREYPYKSITPRIIAEEYLEDKEIGELIDYKFFCFNGEPKIILVCSNRFKNLEETWFNEKFELLDLCEGGHPINYNISKPHNFDKMMELSKKLSEGMPFIRADFYNQNGKIYFGELTLYPASGFEKFDKEIWNQKMGEYIKLPIDK